MRVFGIVNFRKLWVAGSGINHFATGFRQNPIASLDKGGDPLWHIFRFLFNKTIFVKEKITSPPNQNMIRSPMVNQLMRAADWVRAKGQVHPLSEDPVMEESLGILFNVIRRSRKIGLEKLAHRSGFEIEELIAFEAGLLPLFRMCTILPNIANEVGIQAEDLLQQIQTNKNQ